MPQLRSLVETRTGVGEDILVLRAQFAGRKVAWLFWIRSHCIRSCQTMRYGAKKKMELRVTLIAIDLPHIQHMIDQLD